ncbi:anaerobic ribonucleoside-triphosphate reductase [Candidatus Absconditicoccus praedator]|uniref:anaerobic ribonucleoside-triphosphate reductase n=1 Tax=Candidatus Absconditicoccus praedator TaxID=2735562 RepID=UPI001E5A7B26|nr:anaerobic ribonucleoside-triphosphate reductase [Candidatus Absconditicoccus praedator]UFX82521.1 hypothetical protein HLG78_01095 [Candidatus Absconditicoccus praedator]
MKQTTLTKEQTQLTNNEETNNQEEVQQDVQQKRTRCEVYTRVMGYYRPISHFNPGKKSEAYSRRYFRENQSFNSRYYQDY